jgi:hypothetical protein
MGPSNDMISNIVISGHCFSMAYMYSSIEAKHLGQMKIHLCLVLFICFTSFLMVPINCLFRHTASHSVTKFPMVTRKS